MLRKLLELILQFFGFSKKREEEKPKPKKKKTKSDPKIAELITRNPDLADVMHNKQKILELYNDPDITNKLPKRLDINVLVKTNKLIKVIAENKDILFPEIKNFKRARMNAALIVFFASKT